MSSSTPRSNSSSESPVTQAAASALAAAGPGAAGTEADSPAPTALPPPLPPRLFARRTHVPASAATPTPAPAATPPAGAIAAGGAAGAYPLDHAPGSTHLAAAPYIQLPRLLVLAEGGGGRWDSTRMTCCSSPAGRASGDRRQPGNAALDARGLVSCRIAVLWWSFCTQLCKRRSRVAEYRLHEPSI